jgi:hypothetical protein
MKKITTALLLLFSVATFSQMKVSDSPKSEVIGTYKAMGTTFVELTKKDGFCFFSYKDAKFAQLSEYKTFLFRESDLDVLYGLLTDFTGIEKGQEKTVDLEDGEKLQITYKKSMGIMFADVWHVSKAGVAGHVYYMNQNQLKKVFGKG